ncbi:MAG: hypothetical protein J2P26_05350 [Nocardiopsaceae bacterium]|nr:hypothetical protein [Nocardiopsaceae bacterium]
MSEPLVYLTMGRRPTPLSACDTVAERDLYDLAGLDLSRHSGLLIGTAADQISLGENREALDSYVEGGGIVVVCGQVVRPFLTGLPVFEPIDHRRPADLEVTRLAGHPVWEGVRAEDLTFRKGVAGFYGRGCYPSSRLPAGAVVINGIGPDRLPLDFAYRHGRGTVLVHGGNDLWGYRDDPNTSARLTPQLLDWITGGAP